MLIEVCANSLQSAIHAEKAGAHRIELCSELAVGGITPSYGVLKAVREKISLPVNVLIRPRSGDFTYTEDEFDIMLTDIKNCIDLGFDGIVSGVLNTDFSLDVQRTKALIDATGNLSFTFHRAFDWIINPFEALEILEGLNVSSILTSGQQKRAIDGIELLCQLQRKASSTTVMPGGSVNPNNINAFQNAGFVAAHMSGSSFHRTLETSPKISMNSPSFLRDGHISVSDPQTVRAIVNAVK